MYSQTSKCDSLKTVYESKLFDWYKIDVKLKTYDYTSKKEYDSLLVLYHENWKEYGNNKEEYLNFVKDSTLSVKKEAPNRWSMIKNKLEYSVEENIEKDSLQLKSIPSIITESQNMMVPFIKKNYPVDFKESGVSCKAILEFICDTNGLLKNVEIPYIRPRDERCKKMLIEAMDLARFVPISNKYGHTSIKMQMYFMYKNHGEFHPHQDYEIDKIVLEFIPIY
jgi:hypothetical protein